MIYLDAVSENEAFFNSILLECIFMVSNISKEKYCML